jgi:hypothetical protein
LILAKRPTDNHGVGHFLLIAKMASDLDHGHPEPAASCELRALRGVFPIKQRSSLARYNDRCKQPGDNTVRNRSPESSPESFNDETVDEGSYECEQHSVYHEDKQAKRQQCYWKRQHP